MIQGFEFAGLNIWFLAKIIVLLFLIIYIVFSGVVIKQIINMNETLDVGISFIMNIIAIGHFCFAVFVFVFSFLLL
ncbi:MAG: hypothetical protein N2558_03685 [Patescibacteria group bacterium]|nr:hypothetical protein [Patescibacteria group bacterium]